VELAYFGGNFTGISLKEQENFLKLIQPYIDQGKISGIRISTRPDYINKEILDLLKKYNVRSIELGAQSMDDEVLIQSGRGHTLMDIENASRLIIESGFSLGLQMMIGLPGDTKEKSIHTAKKIIELGAENTRIYPTLVIKETQLERLFLDGNYQPLSLEEAVSWSKELLLLFDHANVKVLRLGLHPSEGLLSGTDLIAGPFHPSFRELVLTEIWADKLRSLTGKSGEQIEITVLSSQYNYAIGYNAKNRKMLERKFKKVKFIRDESVFLSKYFFYSLKYSGSKPPLFTIRQNQYERDHP
jgi:histone acetyltransferase (RNA polymerase elongator complex component)